MNGVCFVGTDTGVGKTTCAAITLQHLIQLGLTPAPFKPVETGCSRDSSGALVTEDAVRLLEACRLALPIDTVCPYRFEPPVTPLVAAEAVGTEITISEIVRHYQSLRTRFQTVVVETCGGLLSPISATMNSLDVAREIGLPICLVARSALGTINHTLASLVALRASGLNPVGVILSRTRAERTIDEDTNGSVIERVGDVRVFGTIPYLGSDLAVPDWFGALSDALI